MHLINNGNYYVYVYCKSNGHGLVNSKINIQIINAPSKELFLINAPGVYLTKYGTCKQ